MKESEERNRDIFLKARVRKRRVIRLKKEY